MSKSQPLTTASEVIDRLGGTVKAARAIGCWPTAVSNWRRSGTFPSDKYVVMQELLAKESCSAPASLWQMASKPGPLPKSDEAA